ncbi:MAG: hypothetical protein ACYTGS_17425 [Planctomycetota bacterium]|jgi:hypothetical protein
MGQLLAGLCQTFLITARNCYHRAHLKEHPCGLEAKTGCAPRYNDYSVFHIVFHARPFSRGKYLKVQEIRIPGYQDAGDQDLRVSGNTATAPGRT